MAVRNKDVKRGKVSRILGEVALVAAFIVLMSFFILATLAPSVVAMGDMLAAMHSTLSGLLGE